VLIGGRRLLGFWSVAQASDQLSASRRADAIQSAVNRSLGRAILEVQQKGLTGAAVPTSNGGVADG
jgi:hypothetical protein